MEEFPLRTHYDGARMEGGKRVLLNVDAGELEDEPDALYRAAHLVHVACGGHAGDVASMTRVATVAKVAGTLLGAHPSYPDRAAFGRRSMAIAPEVLAASLREQCAALAAVCRGAHVDVFSVKPHGALYHDANRSSDLASAFVRVAVEVFGATIKVVGPPAGALSEAAHAAKLIFLREGFADRGVRADGSLIPRGEPGALVTDGAMARVRSLELARSGGVDTVCVHGDTAGALAIAAAVREALDILHAHQASEAHR